MIKEVLLRSASFLQRYCYLLIFFPLPSILNGQTKSDLVHLGEHTMEMTYWTLADGLPSWSMTNMVGDSRGFIWLATDKGLCRFDGKKFVHFPLESLGVSAISSIIGEDRNGKLWLLVSRAEGKEEKAPLVFDPVSGSCSTVSAYTGGIGPEGRIQNSYSISDTIFLQTAGGKLWRYDNTLRLVLAAPPARNANVYLPAGNGLFWHLSDATFKNFELIDSSRTFLKTFPDLKNHLSDFWLDKSGRLCLYDPLLPGYGGLMQPYQLSTKGDILPIESNSPRIFHNVTQCRYVAADQLGYGYALTENNKLQVFCKNQVVTNDLILLLQERYNIQPSDGGGLYTPDPSGGIWLKCNGGLLRIRFRPSFVKTYPALKNFSFRGIHALNDEKILVNTYSGSFKINEASGVIAPFAPENGFNYGMAFYRELDTLWMGLGYLSCMGYPLKGGAPAVYPLDSTLYQLYDANAFCRLPDGTLVLGCSLGLLYLDGNSRTLRQYGLKDTVVYCLLAQEGQVWAGTRQGLYNLSTRKLYFGKTPGTEALNIYYIHVDGEGNFWLATQRGLVKWNPGAGAFHAYGLSEGLPQDRFHAIYPDRSGRLWLSSNNGLFCFNPGTDEARAFYVQDGLPDNECNFLAHAQAPNGRLYFGTVKGAFSFDPDNTELAPPSGSPPLYVTGIYLYTANKKEPSDGLTDFLQMKLLRIPAGTNRTVIRLSAPYFGQQSMVYEWRIPGMVDQWQISYEPEISLFMAPYGDYQLEARAYLRGNKPDADVHNLLIPVESQKPLHLRWWVIGMITLGFFFGSLAINRFRLEEVRRRNLILEGKVAARTKEIARQRDIILEQSDALKKLDAVKSRFFSHINHEFRTPLTIINWSIDKLSKSNTQNAQWEESIRRIRKNAAQMKELTEDMLEFARLETESLPVNSEPCNWPSFISHLTGNYIGFAQSKDIEMSVTLEQDLPDWILIDRKKTERIINNLLSNAVKFSPEGGKVSIEVTTSDNMMCVAISDTGVGIPEDDLPRVFNRFFQSEHHFGLMQSGFGLGLSMCREYANLLDGSIDVKSTLGAGSTFTFTFPILITAPLYFPVDDQYDEAPETTLISLSDKTLEAHPAGRAHLLVVEDNKEMQEFLFELLAHNYQITQVYDGEAALAFLTTPGNPKVDLVLSDVMMPKMNGFELLRNLRSRPETVTMPFIFLTALAESENIIEGLQLGVDSYITKPFVTEELEARISNLLHYQRLRLSHIQQADNTLPASAAEPEFERYDAAWLAELKKIVDVHLDKPGLKIDRLAGNMYVSERTLRNKLKAYTGLSPADYLMKARLAKALYLLEHNRYQTIAEVCHAIGLRNPSHFSKVFKEEYGRVPSDYLGASN